jgi:hypothetical protein
MRVCGYAVKDLVTMTLIDLCGVFNPLFNAYASQFMNQYYTHGHAKRYEAAYPR